jgi:NAD(P)-dependent dehydrogenase (short-subunit alcohol dehydrogenase family)
MAERGATDGGLAGRGAIVLGGAGGIGSAIAADLHERGAEVLAVDLAAERPSTVPAGCSYLGGDACAERTVSDAFAAFDPAPTLLVNSLIFERPTPLAEVSAAEFTAPFEVMTRTAWRWGRELAARADGRPAAAVHIASVHAYGAVPEYGPYAAAKAALLALVKTMAVEWGPLGVRSNAVAPGFVLVPRTRPQWSDAEDRARRLARFPLGRFPDTADVAAAVRFLLSADAAAITGICLPVDSGLLARLP